MCVMCEMYVYNVSMHVMYVCMYVRMCVCNAYIYEMYVCMHDVHVMYVRTYVRVCVCMRVRMYACMYVCNVMMCVLSCDAC